MKTVFLFLSCLGTFLISEAQWNADATLNLQASSYVSADIHANMDSKGGTFIAFYKPSGTGNYNMCVQYIDNGGVKMFGADGIILNSYPANSATFVFNTMVDDRDNFIVCFQDERTGTSAVAYKISSQGQSVWETNPGLGDGILLGTGLSPYPCQLSSGDYMFAWNNTSTNKINYCKVLKNGGVLAWPSPKEIAPPISGRGISRAQLVPYTASKWGMVFQQRTSTFGSPSSTNLYAKQLDSAGNILWSSAALSNVVTASSRYYDVQSSGDITFIGYYGNPNLQNRFDSYLQRVDADGTMPWGISGVDFATDQTYYEMNTQFAFVGETNEIWAIATYSNSSQTQYGIYTQRYNYITGARILSDAAQQVFPVSANGEQQPPSKLGICSDGNLQFMFYDVSSKIYAAKISNTGGLLWPGGKIEIAGTTNNKFRYNFAGINGDQAVIVWQETRDANDHAYAQNITCAGNIGVIPVKLEYFRGAKKGSIHQLDWKIACSNTQFARLTIETGTDGRIFHPLYTSYETALRCQQAFVYNNAHVLDGTNYYRLKMQDDNGVTTYSSVVALNSDRASAAQFSIFPNPVMQTAGSIGIYATMEQEASFQLTDLAGRLLFTKQLKCLVGHNSIKHQLNSIAPGSYVLIITISGHQTQTIPVVIQ